MPKPSASELTSFVLLNMTYHPTLCTVLMYVVCGIQTSVIALPTKVWDPVGMAAFCFTKKWMALTLCYSLKATTLLEGKLHKSEQKHWLEARKPDPCVFNLTFQTILLSSKFHCTEEILTIVSLLSVDSVLYNPPAQKDEVQSVRKKFISSEGDHITLLNIYRTFKNIGGNKVSHIHSFRPVFKYTFCVSVTKSSKRVTHTKPAVISEMCTYWESLERKLVQVFILLVFNTNCEQVN